MSGRNKPNTSRVVRNTKKSTKTPPKSGPKSARRAKTPPKSARLKPKADDKKGERVRRPLSARGKKKNEPKYQGPKKGIGYRNKKDGASPIKSARSPNKTTPNKNKAVPASARSGDNKVKAVKKTPPPPPKEEDTKKSARRNKNTAPPPPPAAASSSSSPKNNIKKTSSKTSIKSKDNDAPVPETSHSESINDSKSNKDDDKKEENVKCAGCNQPVQEGYITELDKNWHPNCFKCMRCNKGIWQQSYKKIKRKAYCDACVEKHDDLRSKFQKQFDKKVTNLLKTSGNSKDNKPLGSSARKNVKSAVSAAFHAHEEEERQRKIREKELEIEKQRRAEEKKKREEERALAKIQRAKEREEKRIIAKLEAFKTMIGDGVMLVKYGRNNQMRTRKFTVSWEKAKIYWDSSFKGRGKLRLRNGFKILEGKQTELLMSHPEIDDDHCFSIVTDERTLDLQCSSKKQRDDMVWGFDALLERVQRGEVTSTGSSLEDLSAAAETK